MLKVPKYVETAKLKPSGENLPSKIGHSRFGYLIEVPRS